MNKLKFTAVFAVVGFFALVGLVGAQENSPFSVSSFAHYLDGVDRIIAFDVQNNSDSSLVANGRLVVLNVYDTSPPISLPVNNLSLDAGGSKRVVLRWTNAPFLGKIRSLLVLNDKGESTVVGSFNFWIFPWQAIVVLGGILLVSLGIVLSITRLPTKIKKLRGRVPSNMVAYTVEYGDTIVALANKFGVTWEDIVRANRLKPPYKLRLNSQILIPRHELKKPEEPSKDKTNKNQED